MKRNNAKRSVLHFRRWGNKSFSAFSSLHKVVKVCVLSSAYFVSLGLPSLAAQTQEGVSKEIDLNEVEVNAEIKEVMMENELTRIIAVVSKKDIERSSARSLAQLLDAIPGIDVRQRGAHSTQADLSIRAGSFDQVLILLNGINISDPQTGHNNLNIPISLRAIERIEVLEGAGIRYNAEGAFAGAINIVTQKAEQTMVNAELTGGAFNFWDTQATLGLKQKHLSHLLAMNNTTSDGYIDNTDFSTKRLYYRSAFEKGGTTADLQLGYIDNAFGSNSFYSTTYPDQYEQVKSSLASLKVTTGKTVKMSPKLYYKRTFDRFELFRDMEDAATWYSGHNYHQTDVWGGGSDFNYISEWGNTHLGLDLRHERIRSTNLGEDIDPIAHPQEDSVYFTKAKSRSNYNTFLNHTYYHGNWIVGGNALFNYNGITEKIRPYLGMDVAYQLTDNWRLKGSVNQSFRMPTFTELYYTGSQNTGNADLKQEEAMTYDLGVDYTRRGMAAHASAFHRRGKDIIDWVKAEASDAKWQTMNYSQVNTSGFETALTLLPAQLSERLAFVQKCQATFTYNYSEVAEQTYISYYALDYLKHKFTLSGDFRLYKQLTATVLAQHQERENATDASSEYAPFWLCDATLHWEGKHISPFIEVNNIFDTTYYDFNHLPQAGRWAMAGIKVKL